VFPDRRWDLHYLTAAEIGAHRSPHILPDYASLQPPTLYQGRLYWIERRPRLEEMSAPRVAYYVPLVAGLSVPAGSGSLVSALPDGSDRRTILAESQEPGLNLQGLVRDRTRDRLYILGTSVTVRPGADIAKARAFVQRIPSDGPAPAATARLTMPELFVGGPLALDDGFVYFAAIIPQQGLGATIADLFSAETTRRGEVPTLCRMPLPE
jgi:hypothetical protein